VKLAVSIFDVEMKLVSILSDDRQWFKSRVGFFNDEMPRRDAFCARAILSNNVMIVPDALEDARFRKLSVRDRAPVSSVLRRRTAYN
jgi:hypothetical protein